ncbi:hypothetical protein ACEUB7_06505 [Aeromonas veronii]
MDNSKSHIHDSYLSSLEKYRPRYIGDNISQISDEKLNKGDIQALSAYLNDPVSSGLWRFDAEWSKEESISNMIWEQVSKEIEGQDAILVDSGKRKIKINLDDDSRRNIKHTIFNRLTFIFTLFKFIVEDTPEAESTKIYGRLGGDIQLILDLIDIDLIKSKYTEAINFFTQEIWFQGFVSFVRADHIFRLKCGSIITLDEPRNGHDISIISWSGEPLKKISKFLELLNKTEEIILMPIFSPEEEVFAPYFDLLEITYQYIVKQSHLRPLFGKSINHFKEKNYSDCVISIGLSGEDLLTQVYETFFRTQLTKGLTLGQLADEINLKVDSLYEKKVERPPEFAELYEKIKSAISTDDNQIVKSLETLRELLTKTIENNKYLNSKIENIGKQKQSRSVFPPRVRHAINELIKFRNASSHKSRIPIGPYEATRAIYSLVIFLTWWDIEKSIINWDETPETIIKNCVLRSEIPTQD